MNTSNDCISKVFDNLIEIANIVKGEAKNIRLGWHTSNKSLHLYGFDFDGSTIFELVLNNCEASENLFFYGNQK